MEPFPEDRRARRIARHVMAYYDRLFSGESAPSARLPVLQGKELAAALGYPMSLLQDVPPHAWDRFLPCGNPLPYLIPKPGERFLNLGSGIGIDSLALARSCGTPIHVVNLDIVPRALLDSQAMLSRLMRPGLVPAGILIAPVCAEGDSLPFSSATFDGIIMNGVLNVFPDKKRLLDEAYRVLRENGRLVVMDLCASEELPEYFQEELDGWAWCMSGARTHAQLESLVAASGLRVEHFFGQDPSELIFPVKLMALKPGPSR
jgi:SAM-dependent methyltransferase